MRTLGIILIATGFLFSLGRGIYRMSVYYEYKNTIGSNWDLADAAATIPQKSEYIDRFVLSLKDCHLEGTNNALFFPTPSSDFNSNMKAIESLQQRLKAISGLDENSFAYQTAIQQITAQEQGEAGRVLDNLNGCWEKSYHYTFWSWVIFLLFLLLQFGMIVVGFFMLSTL